MYSNTLLTIDSDDTKELNPIVVGSRERKNLHHIPPYLASHGSDMDLHSNVEAEVNRERVAYQGP